MEEFFKNGMVQNVLAAIIFALLVWFYKKVHFWRDERKILSFIKSSSHPFRSTEAISASTNLEAARIQQVAAKSKKLRRNLKEKESWCVAE